MFLLTMATAAMPAHAFCGTYVGDGESTLTNRASQIVIARAAGTTVLTMFNDYQGDLANFGLVIPVPAGVDADNVRLADRELLTRISGYSQPRLVSYTCDDWYGVSEAAIASGTPANAGGGSRSSSGGGCGGGSSKPSGDWSLDTASAVADTGVVIEDEFELGEYTAWVVSAEGSDGLSGWLESQGFAIDDGTSAALGEYISAGSHFLALRVDLERLDADNWLSPLQVGYESEAWTLPIRLGAASSAGVQDLVIYALTGPEEGATGISNYTETTPPPAECLLALPDDTSFADWYEDQFEALSGLPADPADLAGQQGFTWTTEFAWSSGLCDPCTETGPLTPDDVWSLGFDGHYGWFLTRLHLRYTPDAVTQDPNFYLSGRTENTQVRYVQDAWEMETEFPRCDGTESETPAACYSSEYWARKAEENEAGTDVVNDDFKTCAGGAAVVLLPLLGLLRRRRAGEGA